MLSVFISVHYKTGWKKEAYNVCLKGLFLRLVTCTVLVFCRVCPQVCHRRSSPRARTAGRLIRQWIFYVRLQWRWNQRHGIITLDFTSCTYAPFSPTFSGSVWYLELCCLKESFTEQCKKPGNLYTFIFEYDFLVVILFV